MKTKARVWLIWGTFIGIVSFSLGSCKAKKCPAYHEGEKTGGTIDKNKRNKRKSGGDLFGKKVRRKTKF